MESVLQYPATHVFDTMSTPEPQQQFLKLEDLHNPPSASPAPSSFDDYAATSASPPPPVIVQSKPAKKRKSWGQELPEPKTNLPPRKRAKTDDEKEQRRIERIKRNRAAAHNSRERKRQETETLAVALARANAELDAYRKLHGPLPPSIILPEVTLSSDTPLSEDYQSKNSADEPTSRAASPVDSLFKSSPRAIKQEPLETAFPISLPLAFDGLDTKSALSPTSLPLDPTQHSAAMLCDLPCRSSRNDPSLRSRWVSSSPSRPPLPRTIPNSWWSQFFLTLMSYQLQSCYRALLMGLWTLSPSRMARLTTRASANPSSLSTTSSTRPPPSRLTRRRLALSSDSATGLRAPLRVHGAGQAPLRPSVEGVRREENEVVVPESRRSASGEEEHRSSRARKNGNVSMDRVDHFDGVGGGRVT